MMLLTTVLFLLLTVSSAIRGDPDLSARVETLEARAVRAEQEIKELKVKLANQDSSSFFSVQFTEDVTIPYGDILQFNDVIVNFGDDYIQSGGLYIAPEVGYYMFTLVVREPHDDFTAGSIMRTLTTDPEDTVMLCRAEIGNFEHQTGTCTVITELLAGDQVYVVAEGFLDDSEDNRYQADGYTSFTGVQIRSGLQ